MHPYGPDVPWRLDPSIAFLNHGSFGACPVPVIAAQRALIDRLEADPVRFLSVDIDDLIGDARAIVSRFLGADPEGLVFVPNATTGVSTVLRSLAFRPGDELLTTDHEYNATLNALAEVARRDGARVVVARIPLPITNPGDVVEAILAAVTPRTRLALVSHITSPTAAVLPIEAIVRELDARGIDTLVDAAHAPGQVAVDVEALGAAYWTANGHKWLCGPKGSGVLVVRADRRDRIRPLVISHGWNDLADRPRLWKEFDWTGTVDPTPFLALPEAIRVVGALDPGGWPAVMAANRSLALDARARLLGTLGTEPLVPGSMVGSMAAVRLPGDWTTSALDALGRALRDDGVVVPVVGFPVPAARDRAADPPAVGIMRVSAQRYNEPADYDRLTAALGRRLADRLPARGPS